MPRAPRVSIIVPTYNRSDTLQRAIRSLDEQTFRDFEIVVVDDGSTDGTELIVKDMETTVPLRYIKHERNRGVCAAKNTGLDNVQGDWFGILDSDDELVPEALETLMAVPDRVDKGINAVVCNCIDTTTGGLSGKGPPGDRFFTLEDRLLRFDGELWGIGRTVLLGKDRLNESIPGLEDILWYKMHRRARAYYVHKGLRIYHTEGEDRVTKEVRRAKPEERARLYEQLLNEVEYLNVFKQYRTKRYRKICRKGYLYSLAVMNVDAARKYRELIDEEGGGIGTRMSLAILAILKPVLPRLVIRLTEK